MTPHASTASTASPNLFTRTCTFIAKACLNIGVVGMVLLVIAVLYQVFGRYIMNSTPTWAESSAVLLVLYVTMLGVAVGVHDAGHIGLESLLVLAPDWLRMKLEILIHALVVLFGVVMAWNCGILAESVMDYKMPDADGVETLLENDNLVFLEVGPGNMLGSFVRQNPRSPTQRVLSSMRHPNDGRSSYRTSGMTVAK